MSFLVCLTRLLQLLRPHAAPDYRVGGSAVRPSFSALRRSTAAALLEYTLAHWRLRCEARADVFGAALAHLLAIHLVLLFIGLVGHLVEEGRLLELALLWLQINTSYYLLLHLFSLRSLLSLNTTQCLTQTLNFN